jgi:protein involved in polysaccharide export with SLBB domain
LNFDFSVIILRTFLVHVVGYVTHPGLYPASAVTRVGTLLKSGGPGEIVGSSRRIQMKRRDGKQLTGDLVMYELTGNSKFNPTLLDGDIVEVPFPGTNVSIAGAVTRPGTYELTGAKDLRELVEVAGGYRTTMTRQLPLRIVRRNATERQVERHVPVPADDRAAAEIKLDDGDTVWIPSVNELQRTVTLVGPVVGGTATDEVSTVRRFPYAEGTTVRAVIETAGGVGPSADLRAGYIKKANGETEKVDLDALLVRRDFSADRRVDAGDTIIVPQKRYSIAVTGAVMNPGLFAYNPDFVAQSYLNKAGGPSQDAQSMRNCKVISPSGKIARMQPDLKLQPGDTIAVPEKTFSNSQIAQIVIAGAGIVLTAATLVFVATK